MIGWKNISAMTVNKDEGGECLSPEEKKRKRAS
jgi:hypothetical protein